MDGNFTTNNQHLTQEQQDFKVLRVIFSEDTSHKTSIDIMTESSKYVDVEFNITVQKTWGLEPMYEIRKAISINQIKNPIALKMIKGLSTSVGHFLFTHQMLNSLNERRYQIVLDHLNVVNDEITAISEDTFLTMAENTFIQESSVELKQRYKKEAILRAGIYFKVCIAGLI